MKRSIIIEGITFFFILLFLYTGIMKLLDISEFRQQLSSSPLIGSLAGIVVWALPWGEILLAIVLFLPRWRLAGFYATLVMMSLFTGYLILLLSIDDPVNCSCGGIIEELSPPQHLLFNGSCVILSILGIQIHRRPRPTLGFRRLAGFSVLGLFVLTGGLLIATSTAPVVEKSGMEGRLLPAITLTIDSSTRLSTEDIPEGKPFVVIGFSPWCSHCQALTADIIKHMAEFENTRIYFVSSYKLADIRVFNNYFHLSHYPNIVLGRDSTNTLFHFFRRNVTPLIAIFDARKRLKKLRFGQISALILALNIKE